MEAEKTELQRTADANTEKMRKRMEAEIADLQSNVSKLEADLTKAKDPNRLMTCGPLSNMSQANKNHVQDLQTAHEEYTVNRTELAARLQRAEEKAEEAEARSQAASDRAAKAEKFLSEKESERKAVQSELDDLLMVFGDLEEQSEKYKARLKELGETISDGEDEDEADEDDVD